MIKKVASLTHYVNANFFHSVVTGRSVSGILYIINAGPIDWYSNKQDRAETAIYGLKFVAACTCVEQIINFNIIL